MPEVQSVGAVDYAQYQPIQQNDYAENYNMEPEIYDENMEEMRAANKSRLGATILTSTIIGGLALWGGHAWGKKGAKAMEQALNETKQQLTDAKQVMKEIADDASAANDEFLGGMRKGKEIFNKIEEKFEPFIKDAEKVAEDAEDAAKDVVK